MEPKGSLCVHTSTKLVHILSQVNPIHNLPPYPHKMRSNNVLASTPRSSDWSLLKFSNQNFVCISHITMCTTCIYNIWLCFTCVWLFWQNKRIIDTVSEQGHKITLEATFTCQLSVFFHFYFITMYHYIHTKGLLVNYISSLLLLFCYFYIYLNDESITKLMSW
jgi:hypothetical protein